MESAQSEVRYHITAKVENIESRQEGWFVQFAGSRESLNFGIDAPPWAVGDAIHMTFIKVDNALPSQPPV